MLVPVFGLDILCKEFRKEDLNQVTGKYLLGVKVLKMWIVLHTWAVWLPKMEELHGMSRNEFEKQMVLSYNSIQYGGTTEYLLGPNSASSVVILSQCCYMDLRHGKK